MTSRLSARFTQLRREGRAGLVAYVMACDPDLETSFEILKALPAAGADVIELGFPFSDPSADGISIQKAAERSLNAGGSLRKALDLAARFREADQTTPLVLMGYANPVERLGAVGFAAQARDAGVDGAIIVDLPPEEDEEIRVALAGAGVSLIRLATPTTDAQRLPTVLSGVSGFLYYVSITGVTGAKAATLDEARAAVARLKAATDLPVALGFGVREPDAAAAIARFADAVVVGSAFVDAVSECVKAGDPGGAPKAVAGKVQAMSDAVRNARNEEAAA
jgi:tryptophan synthase alpha chain